MLKCEGTCKIGLHSHKKMCVEIYPCFAKPGQTPAKPPPTGCYFQTSKQYGTQMLAIDQLLVYRYLISITSNSME